jgi:hypothetical protein
VSIKPCPTETELLSFVDGDLAPEPLQRVGQHLKQCAQCTAQANILFDLILQIKRPVAEVLDVQAHVASVVARLDVPVRRGHSPARAIWGALGFAAAAGVLALLAWGPGSEPQFQEFAARGAASAASLARDVGIQLYTQEDTLVPLQPRGRIRQGSALTASLRNLTGGQAHLLLFAIDAQHAVHWIAPAFTTPGTNPLAFTVASTPGEQLLPSAVVFDDLALGPLRIVALITSEPLSVSDIEQLTPEALDSGLLDRFPQAVTRQITIEVTPE